MGVTGHAGARAGQGVGGLSLAHPRRGAVWSRDHAAARGRASTRPAANEFALVVGVGRFRGAITPLQYANKDAYDVYTYLVDPAGGNFRRDNVILLRDEHATRDRVVRALDEIQRAAREDDSSSSTSAATAPRPTSSAACTS